MSNVYYNNKKLLSEGLPPNQSKKTGFLQSLFGSKKEQVHLAFTVEDVKKILNLSISGVNLVASTSVPYKVISWKNKDKEYDHADFGKVYMPKHIYFTDGQHDFYIVLIDNTIELVEWPGYRVQTKNREEKLNAQVVTNPKKIRDINQSFKALAEFTHINQQSQEQKNAISGVDIDLSDIKEMFKAVLPHNTKVNELADQLYAAATKPIDFFKTYQSQLELWGVYEPQSNMYQLFLLDTLEKHKVLVFVDWKTVTHEEINKVIAKLSDGKIKNLLQLDSADLESEKVFSQTNVALKDKNLILANIRNDSDTYNLILVPLDEFESVKSVFKKCKINLQKAQDA